MKATSIFIMILFFIFSFNAKSQQSVKLTAEAAPIDNEIYLFLEKLSKLENVSIIPSKLTTKYYQNSDHKTCYLVELNYPAEIRNEYGNDDWNYTLTYSGTIYNLSIHYYNMIGLNITQGSIIKVGDSYVLTEIFCGKETCETLVIRDGAVVFKKSDE